MTKKPEKIEELNQGKKLNKAPGIENEQKNKKSNLLKNIDTEDKNTILIKKFNELPLNKKSKYLHTVFGTIRGMTGFFDTRYTAGMPDHKSFDIDQSSKAEVIIENSGTYSDEGGPTRSNNKVIVIIGDKIFTSETVEYYETDKIDRKNLDYIEILECEFDQTKNSFLVSVKCADDSAKEIEVNQAGKYEFEEKLIGELWVPVELLGEEEIQDSEELETELTQENKEIAQQNMNQRAVDILILEGGRDNRKRAEEYMKKEGIRLSEDQKKTYIDFLFEDYYKGGRDDIKKIYEMIGSISDEEYKKVIYQKIADKAIGLDDDELFVKANEVLGIDNTQSHIKKIEHTFDRGLSYLEELDLLIEKYGQDPKVWYEKVLEKAGKEGLIIGYDNDYAKKVIPYITEVLGKTYDEIFEKIFLKNLGNTEINYCSLRDITDIIESKGYEKTLYNDVWDKMWKNEELRESGYAKEKREILAMIAQLKKQVNKKIPKESFIDMIYITHKCSDKGGEIKQLYQGIWKGNISDYSPEEKKQILGILSDNYIAGNYCLSWHDLIDRGLEDKEKILQMIELLLDKEHYVADSDKLIELLKEKNIIDDKFQKQIDEMYKNISNLYCDGKQTGSNNYCDETLEEYSKYADKELVEKYVKNKLNDYIDRQNNMRGSGEFYFTHIGNCISNAGFDQNYIQNIINEHIEKGQYDLAMNLIKGFGLNIDKIRVNTLVKDLFDKGEIEKAESMVHAGGLYDIWKNKLIIKKLENKMMDSRDAKRAIEKSGLDKSYYQYVIDMHINSGNMKEALELANEHDLIISDKQFDWYLGRDERLKRADEERKQKEKEEREKKAIEMMKLVLEGKMTCDVDYKKDQKYVLIRDLKTGLKIASHNLERHKDIVSHIGADGKNALGGGRIMIDNENKTLKLYGSSGSYGGVYEEYNEIMIHIIKLQYPEHDIQIQ